MTRLKYYRQTTKQTLREVAEKVGVTIASVHDAEVRGLQTVRSARKYAAAFPGHYWRDLIDEGEPEDTGEKTEVSGGKNGQLI